MLERSEDPESHDCFGLAPASTTGCLIRNLACSLLRYMSPVLARNGRLPQRSDCVWNRGIDGRRAEGTARTFKHPNAVLAGATRTGIGSLVAGRVCMGKGRGNCWGTLVAKFKRLAVLRYPCHLGPSLPVLRLELAVSLGLCDAPTPRG
jgi:hypothetical protein